MPSISQQIEKINEIFIELYVRKLNDAPQIINDMGEIKPAGSEIAPFLAHILIFQQEHPEASYEDYKNFIAQEIFGKQLGEAITFDDFKRNPLLPEVLSEYAKINEIMRRIRVICNQQYFDQNFSQIVADSPDYSFRVLKEAGVDSKALQDFFNKTTIRTVTTSHPTNPNSVSYTEHAMKLAHDFANLQLDENGKIFDFADVEESLETVIATPITGPKKTQELEVEEAILYLKSIYDSVPHVYNDLRKSADESEVYHDLKLPEKLYDFAVWVTGDGDGNPNSTEQTLRYNIERFRAVIKEFYVQDLEQIAQIAPAEKQDLIARLKSLITNDPEYDASELAEVLYHLKKDGSDDYKNALDDLIVKVNNFGLHFAKIDLRHESSDIMKTVYGLLKAVNAIPADMELKNLSSDYLKEAIRNPAVIEAISGLQTRQIQPFGNTKDDELVRRIFGRLRAIAQNPDMCDKFIIAEFKEEKNIQAVLLLLKASGNAVANENAKINIVPLAEEKATLDTLHQDIAASLRDPAYLAHVKNTKKVYFMIAKSDTVRRGGVGAQRAQALAVKNSIKSIIKTLLEQGVTRDELKDYEIVPYNGGGHALQRGGGRITELPSVYGRYALKALRELQEEGIVVPEIKIAAPCFTVQGHQNSILFDPAEITGRGTLRALVSQSIYSQARLKKLIADNEVEINGDRISVDEKYARALAAEKAEDYACDIAMAVYEEEILPKNGPINILFQNGCWTSTKIGNVSSRSSVRGVSDNSAERLTVGQVKGANNVLLDQRAIGAEKLCAHTGTNLISWFGWAEALRSLKEKAQEGKFCSLNEMYKGSKSMRDYMRSAATSLYMTDFGLAWQMMIGKERPSQVDIMYNAASYQLKTIPGQPEKQEPTIEETLSYIEIEAQNTKALIYETMTGKAVIDPQSDKFNIMEKWPELKKEIDNRKKYTRFGNVTQAILTDLANKNPEAVLDKTLFACFKDAYSGADTTAGAPTGAAATFTKTRTDQRDLEQKEVPLASAFEAVDKRLAKMDRNFEIVEDVTPQGSLSVVNAAGLQTERSSLVR